MKKLKLTRGKYALVDDEDFKSLSNFKWYASRRGYAISNPYMDGMSKVIYMHRLVIKTPKNFHTDHINHNKLDNRRSNLRIANKFQNNSNKKYRNGKSYKGIHKDNKTGKWLSQICHKGKRIFLGGYIKKKDAMISYNEAAKKIHGEFCFLNKIK